MAKYGDLMGWNCDPTEANCALAANLGTKWIRWGPEAPWYMSTPTNTSSYGTLDFSGVATDVALVHSHGLGAMVALLGVPRSMNTLANTGNGGWHYFPTDGAKRDAWKAVAVQLAATLDPARDYLQVGNEINNATDFNLGDQSPTEVGQALAECIIAVRAFFPTLRIIMGSLNPIGDMNNSGTNSHSMPVWGAQMLAGEPRLLTTAKPNLWGIHTYSYGNGANDVNGNDPQDTTKGWLGHVQAVAYRQKIIQAGLANPIMCITEMGEPSSPPTDFTEDWQNTHAVRDFAACDYYNGLGWYGGPQIRHNLVDTSLVIDGTKKFGAMRADQTAKPLGNTIFARAYSTLGGSSLVPVSSFTGVPGAGLSMQFTDTSTNSPTGWLWAFGDGASSTSQNPSHTYASAGTYSVTLAVANSAGNDAHSNSYTISVAAPTANLSWVSSGLVVQFTDLSTNGPTSWAWNFGDSATSTLKNPSHTYASAGTYTVTFAATNASGTDTITRTVTVSAIVTGSWDYDSPALPFDFAGPLDDPFGTGVVAPPVGPVVDTVVDLGTPPIPGLDTGYFTLDASVLDGPDLLGPDIVWHRLTGVVTSANWHRGIDEERNHPDAGSATVICQAKNRELDPSFPTGRYAPYLYQRPSIRVTVDGVPKFTGTAENVGCVYDGPLAVTTFTCADGWSFLQQDSKWTPGVVERSGDRIARLLRKGGYRGLSWLATGTVWMQAGTEQSGKITDQIADCIQAEDGFAYFDGSGTLIFLDRGQVESLAPQRTISDVFSAGIHCTAARYGSDTATFWPTVKVAGIEKDSTTMTAGKPNASSRHGDRILSLQLPIAFESDRQNLADHLVSIYGQFRPRFRTVDFAGTAGQSITDRGGILASSLGTGIRVKTSPPLGGSSVESPCVVIGETGAASHHSLDIFLTVQESRDIHYFTLDDPTYGRLDGPAVLAP